MDSLDLIKTFREVASHGSFSRAATKLDVSKATVSKYIAELETRLGVRLLNRSTRAVSLTDAGALLLERSKPMMEMFELTQAEVQEHANHPTGRLRISAPLGAGQGDLPKMIGEFMGHYPDVSISLQLLNRAPDMAEEGIDLALHFGPVAGREPDRAQADAPRPGGVRLAGLLAASTASRRIRGNSRATMR